MKKLIDIATDPEQYSEGRATTWLVDESRQKHQQTIFWNAIYPFIKTSCKSVLDIGCGSGWSAKKFSEFKADWVGIEPSSVNFDIASKTNSEFNIVNTTLEKYTTTSHFDCIMAIIVFSHVRDINNAFNKIYELLNDEGVFIMLNSDFHDEDSRLERNGRKYEVEVIDDNQCVDKAIIGSYGIADINRKSEYYIDEAVASGFSLISRSKVEDVGYSPKELLVFTK